jgi:DmsE family decaheme c-type cytochrome
MNTSIQVGVATIPTGRADRGSGNKAAIHSTSNSITLLAAGLIFSALLGFAQPAGAADSYSALANFVQQIGAEQPKLIAASGKSKSADDSYSALADFVQRIGAEQPKLAAAEKSKTDPWDITGSAQQKGPIKPVKAKPGDDGADAIYIGSKRCLDCHASQAAEFDKTLMGRIGKTQKGKMECENCHGPGSAHVKAGGGRGVGGIISFRPNDSSRKAEENNAICLSCHERGDRTYWNGSTHETRGLACTNCHTIMKSVSVKHQMKTAFEPDTCFQCHKDRRAQMFRSSHMPLREGKITCSNCHNPHGSFTDALLRENSINDNCYKCHAEKRGPFLFEHAPVRENCLNCHDPHGSVNEALLKISRPRLCAECHGFDHEGGIATGPKTRFSFGRACNNCHTQIHGSNHPSGALFHR